MRKLLRYLLALAIVAIASLLRWLLPGMGTPYLVFYPAVVLAALFSGFGPGLLATLAAVPVILLLFNETPGHINPANLIRLAVFVLCGAAISTLAGMRNNARAREGQRARELRESEDRFRGTFENAAVGISHTDATGHFLRYNQKLCDILGYSREELPGMGIMDLTHPDDRTADWRAYQRLMRGEVDSYRVEKRYIHKIGVPLWMEVHRSLQRDEAGRPAYCINIVEEITRRKRAEAVEKHFRAMFESAPGLYLVLRPRGVRFVIAAASDAYLRATMTQRKEIMGKDIFEVLPDPPDDPRADGVKNLRASLERVKVQRRADVMAVQYYPVRRPADLGGGFEERWWTPVNTPVLGPNEGELTYIIHRVEDVTPFIRQKREEGKEIEGRQQLDSRAKEMEADIVLRSRELQQANEQLAAAKQAAEKAKAAAEEANNAKDHFLAVLSHELRNPLVPVLTTASMLQQDDRLDERVKADLEVIRRNAELEARLIDDLLDVTRITRGKLQLIRRPVELSTILHHAVEVCKPDIEARQLHFSLDIKDAPHTVHADPGRLQQVFWNIIKNAVKFTPHGGCLGVRCWREDQKVVVAVNDSGIGIEPASIDRIFKAFEQVHMAEGRQFGGLGLGLAISKALVQMHGGTIAAHSEGKDKGATFTVTLPLASTAAPRPEGGPPQPQVIKQARSLSILLVEDHGDTAQVMMRALSKLGHRPQTSGDVATALELADEHRFDLLVSDLGLPDGSGIDLLRKLRSRGHRFPAIALSGYGQDQDVRQSLAAGFSQHLTKPIDFQHLREAITEIAANHEGASA